MVAMSLGLQPSGFESRVRLGCIFFGKEIGLSPEMDSRLERKSSAFLLYAGIIHDASQQGKVAFAIVLTSMMGDLTYAENGDRYHMYSRGNGNDRAALRMYPAQFPDQQMPDHRNFQWLHRQLRETRSSHVIRHDAVLFHEELHVVQIFKKAS
ncbi:hypothetical protein TNCV_2953761 [Trichonephila clavipes]|nr:hypothetical protein TNCV_2953761 [Trichonephila clavipes]